MRQRQTVRNEAAPKAANEAARNGAQSGSAKGAEYNSQGQARAKRVRRPWLQPPKQAPRPEGPKYYYALSGLGAF